LTELSGGARTPPVYIWIRATLDWDDPAVVDRVDAAFRPKLETWNRTFTLSYQQFRSRLRRIAADNLSHVEGVTTTRDWDAIPDGAVVLPVDDDDWFAPDVARALCESHDAAAVAYRWPSTFLEVPTTIGHHVHLARRAVAPWTPPKQFCTTNNYALVKEPAVRALAENHMRAGEALRDAPGVRQLPGRLSVMNRSLASQTTIGHLRPAVTRGHLLRKHRRYARLYGRAQEGMPAWSRPYVRMMRDLMLEIRPR